MDILRDILFLPPVLTLVALIAVLLVRRERSLDDTYIYGALFAGAVAFFYLGRLTAGRFGILSDLATVAGDATCGWSWLLSRALFRPKAMRASPWPLILVLVLAGAGAIVHFASHAAEPFAHIIGNIEGLASSTVLLVALSEPFRGLRADMPPLERRFRLVFSGGYASLVAICVLWVSGAPAGSVTEHWGEVIKVTCAMAALMGAVTAIWYRRRHPFSDGTTVKPRVAIPEETELGARILKLVRDDAAYARANLKVADLASRLNAAEYKVTRCITGALGFRNFNQMVNHFRVEEAGRALADPASDHLPVLTIALDCGFGSIGPFNRAFKAQFGDTPTAYREARRGLVRRSEMVSLPR